MGRNGSVYLVVGQAKKRGTKMRSRSWVFVPLFALSLVAGCSRSDEVPVSGPTYAPQPTDTPEPTETPDSEIVDSTPLCPAASGEGTVSPAVSIYSITFMVNGLEQVVRKGDRLQGMPGDEMEVKEVTICAGLFSGNGGEACVDFVPVESSGEEVVSEHGGTHLVRVTAGLVSIPGPGDTWTIDESWEHVVAVVNHWPPEDTEDPNCGDRQCEHDDWVIIGLR